MIVKGMLIGGGLGLFVGLFLGMPLETMFLGGIFGIVIRKRLLHLFWR